MATDAQACAAGARQQPAAECQPSAHASLTQGTVLLLAVACGATAANLYYVQPLLNLIGSAFGVSDGTAGLLVTAAQIGYVAGLSFLVPAGDVLERRRLISGVLIGTSVALAACALAPSFIALLAALLAAGALSVVAQLVVPLASTLAAPEQRGQIVGKVMSGLLIGILLSRTLSGLIGQLGGWRLVFALASAGMLALSLAIHRALPRIEPETSIRYPHALRSVITLIAEQPVLRERMVLGAIGFGNFSILWTSVTFLLGRAPYGYSSGVIGLFGLAGAAGALVAPVAGRLSDQGHGRRALPAFLGLVLAGWGLLALGAHSLPALIGGIVILDLGVQGAQISNQTTIYRLRPEARSRLTTAYIVSIFLGGIAGSTASARIFQAGGWSAVCATGAATAAVAVAIAIVVSQRRR